MIEEKGHARRGPSGAKRRKLCPGSVVMEEGKENKSSRYAAEGTVAHTVMELCLSPTAEASQMGIAVEPLDAESFLGRMFESDGYEFEVTQEMAEAVNLFVAGVMAYCTPEAGDILLVEQQVPVGFITGEEGATGTADVVVIAQNGTRLCVFDLKYGKGVAVWAIERGEDHDTRNEQLVSYALGALEEHGLCYPFEEVVFGIGQTRKHDELDVATMTVAEAADELKRLKRIEGQCDSAEADANADFFVEKWLRPSEAACKFCNAKTSCPALLAEVTEAVSGSGSACSADDFDDLEVADPRGKTEGLEATQGAATAVAYLDRAMVKVPLIEEWCKAVRAELDDHLLNKGGQSTRFKVVQGKKGARAWTDPVEAAAVLKAARLKVDEMYNQSLKTAPQMEKVLKDRPRIWKKLADLIAQKDGKPSVAPIDDPRPALVINSTADDFADLGDDDGSDLV